jgi:ribosomal protein L7/L12
VPVTSTNDIYERLGALEQLVKHLYERTGVPMPDPVAITRNEVSPRVRELVASGNKIGAIKAYREEMNVDLATATRVVESLYA